MPLLTLFERLRPELKEVLDASVEEYTIIPKLYEELLDKVFYEDLSIYNVKTLITFSDMNAGKLSTWDWKYGDAFFIDQPKEAH